MMTASLPLAGLALALLLLAAGAYAGSARRGHLWLLGLLAGLLLQEQFIRILDHMLAAPDVLVRFASLWKEALLAGLACRMLAVWYREPGSRPGLRAPEVALLVLYAIAVVHALFSPDRLAAVAALRNLFEPVLLLYLARTFAPPRPTLRRALQFGLILMSAIAALGLWQALAWPQEAYETWGYVREEGWIPTVWALGRLRFRPSATLAGPNVLGEMEAVFLVLAAGMAVTLEGRGRRLAAASLPLLSAALVYTYSRSGLLTLSVAVLVFLASLAQRPALRARIRAMFSNRLLLAAAMALAAGLAAVLALSGMAGRIFASLNSFSGQFHVQDKLEALRFLLQHPAGVGMGLAGPRVGLFFPKTYAYHVESSLLQIALDMGLWGLMAWLLWAGLLWLDLWRIWGSSPDPERRLLAGAMACLLPGLALSFLTLPLMQNLTLMAWVWSLTGWALGRGTRAAGAAAASRRSSSTHA